MLLRLASSLVSEAVRLIRVFKILKFYIWLPVSVLLYLMKNFSGRSLLKQYYHTV